MWEVLTAGQWLKFLAVFEFVYDKFSKNNLQVNHNFWLQPVAEWCQVQHEADEKLSMNVELRFRGRGLLLSIKKKQERELG